jgi:transcriptional antiterminator RfaH
MAHWYLLYTKPRQERTALAHLERQGYAAYLPLGRARRRRGSRQVQVLEALFPRYLFVWLDDEKDDWAPLRSTVGAVGLVRFGDLPARAPQHLVEALRARADADGVHALPGTHFRPGDRVRVVDGALAGLEGVYAARTGAERVTVLLQLMGHANPVQLPVGFLERA